MGELALVIFIHLSISIVAYLIGRLIAYIDPDCPLTDWRSNKWTLRCRISLATLCLIPLVNAILVLMLTVILIITILFIRPSRNNGFDREVKW